MTKRTDAWMPLYIGPYLRDTGRLTAEGHGAYLLLLMEQWLHGPLPDDDSILAAIARVLQDRWSSVRKVLEPFFKIKDGVWENERLTIEKNRAIELSEKRAIAGSKRQANGKQNRQQTRQQIPEQTPQQPGTPLTSNNTSTNVDVARKRASRIDLASHEFTEAERGIVKGFGLDPEIVLAKVRNWAVNAEPRKRRKLDVAAFLRNWCADEKPPAKVVEPEKPVAPIVTPDCWQNGFLDALNRAGPNVQYWLRQCVPSRDGEDLILDAAGYAAIQLEGRYRVDLVHVWPNGKVIIRTQKSEAA